MQRDAKRRQMVRRSVIVAVVAVVVIGTAALLFSGKSSTPSSSTVASATTTLASTATTAATPTTAPAAPITFKPVASPSPAGVAGKAPTVVVPAGNPPTTPELSDLIKGTGPAAKAGDKLTVQYVLATYSTRKVIQSSWTSQPFSFTLGAGQVITGWDAGVVGMQAGGRRELILPPSVGYGSSSPGAGIAANDTLVFVVDLVKIG